MSGCYRRRKLMVRTMMDPYVQAQPPTESSRDGMQGDLKSKSCASLIVYAASSSRDNLVHDTPTRACRPRAHDRPARSENYFYFPPFCTSPLSRPQILDVMTMKLTRQGDIMYSCFTKDCPQAQSRATVSSNDGCSTTSASSYTPRYNSSLLWEGKL